MQYEKPELLSFDNYDATIVQGTTGDPVPGSCGGAPCVAMPGVSGRSARMRPLVLDSQGNPVIVSDK